AVDAWLRDATGSLLALLRAIGAAGGASRPARLYVVTRGAQALDGDAAPERAPAATLVGLARTAATELPGVQVRLVDLDPQGGGLEPLLAELATEDAQEESAWRQWARYVPRLAPADDDDIAPYEL